MEDSGEINKYWSLYKDLHDERIIELDIRSPESVDNTFNDVTESLITLYFLQ